MSKFFCNFISALQVSVSLPAPRGPAGPVLAAVRPPFASPPLARPPSIPSADPCPKTGSPRAIPRESPPTPPAGISLFNAETRKLPLSLDMMERHPDGSQAFIPMSMDGFLVIVAEDDRGKPGRSLAFQTAPGQAINFHKGTWHGVLTPLAAPGLFAVIDRIG